MKITVRALTPDDRQEWETLYREYAEFYQVPMTSEIMDTVWSWIFEEDYGFYALVAKNGNNRQIGLMHFREMPSPLRGKKVGFLDNLFVLPDSRGTGVVDEMFKNLSKESAQNGRPFVRWITAEDNFRGRGVCDQTTEKTKWVTYQMSV